MRLSMDALCDNEAVIVFAEDKITARKKGPAPSLLTKPMVEERRAGKEGSHRERRRSPPLHAKQNGESFWAVDKPLRGAVIEGNTFIICVGATYKDEKNVRFIDHGMWTVVSGGTICVQYERAGNEAVIIQE